MLSETPTRRRLTPEEVAARITWRVAELRVIAAQAALEYARMKTDEAWKAFDSIDRD